jgi:urease accessory protein
MNVYNIYEGNRRSNETLADSIDDSALETVVVTETERRRSRFRTETASETEVGIVVGHELRTGDILAAADKRAPLLEVEIMPIRALAFDISVFPSAREAVTFGHMIGNRHWNLAIRDDSVLVHTNEPEDHVIQTVSETLPPGADIEWETVPPDLFDTADSNHSHSTHGEHG